MASVPAYTSLTDKYARMALLQLLCEGVAKMRACEMLGIPYQELQRYQRQPGVRRILGDANRASRTSEFSVDGVRDILERGGDCDIPEGWKWVGTVERVPPLTPFEVLGIPDTPPPQDAEMQVIAANVFDFHEDHGPPPGDQEPAEGPAPVLPKILKYPGEEGLCDYTWTLAADPKQPAPFRSYCLSLLHRRENHLKALEVRREIAQEKRKAAGARFARPAPGTEPDKAPKGRQRGLRAAAVEEVRRELIGPKPLRGADGDASD